MAKILGVDDVVLFIIVPYLITDGFFVDCRHDGVAGFID